MPNAARDQAMFIFTWELPSIRTGGWVERAIGVTFQGDGGHGDDWTFGEPLFQLVILGLTLSQSEPPAIVMDHDTDVVRVIEGRRRAIERRIVKLPFRRGELPDQLVEVPGVLAVSKPPAFGREVELVPPLELNRWWQWLLVRLLAADQVATHGYKRPAALWPERGDDVGTSRSPIEAGNDRAVDFQRIHQCSGVEREGRGLGVA